MLTGKQLSKELELSVSTIRAYAREGRIPFVTTPGGHRRYELTKVRASLAKPTNEAGPTMAEATPVASWRPSITTAMLREDQTPERDGPLRIPMIGVPGTSQFAVGHGART